LTPITLPLESTITLHNNGQHTVEHHTFVTGEVGQEFVEAVFRLAGGSVEESIRQIDEKYTSKKGGGTR